LFQVHAGTRYRPKPLLPKRFPSAGERPILSIASAIPITSKSAIARKNFMHPGFGNEPENMTSQINRPATHNNKRNYCYYN
jgi:hypothetical protein